MLQPAPQAPPLQTSPPVPHATPFADEVQLVVLVLG
jgi:hypothetical protein